MTSITSKVQICNMALGHLGNYGTVQDIDSPVNDKEITFALWYDVTRKAALRFAIPNFAMARRIVAKKATTPDFGYAYEYEYPSDCVRVLGFGDIAEKDMDYSIEGNTIMMDTDFTTGLKLRFIKDFEDVSLMSADFQILFSWMLAGNTALSITQKQATATRIENALPAKISQLSGINAQENPPIRISTSKFKQARYSTPVRNGSKK